MQLRLEGCFKRVDWRRLKEKKTIDLDVKFDRRFKKNQKIYVKVEERFMVNEGLN